MARSDSTVQRGYGQTHKRLRKQWKALVQAGKVTCTRCKKPIVPGEDWDLGHDDFNRSVWTGPEHAYCNRAAKARKRSRRW